MNLKETKEKNQRKFHLPYERQKALVGFLFILPWLVGAVWFFVLPFIDSVLYSFNDVKIATGEMISNFVGWQNYVKAFTGDPDFLKILYDTLYRIWYEILSVIVFSCFLALLMNGKYRGRVLVRGVFFLPVIIASGVIMQVFTYSNVTNGMLSGSPQTAMFQGVEFTALLLDMGLPSGFVKVIGEIINSLFTLVWKSGVQTILLLAGLQSVPKSAYEAAQMEGATSWECFWKITFPMISPIFVLCSFYTVIDLSNDSGHLIVQYIHDWSSKMDLSYASTLANIWFVIIMLCVGIVFLFSRKKVFFMEDIG